MNHPYELLLGAEDGIVEVFGIYASPYLRLINSKKSDQINTIKIEYKYYDIYQRTHKIDSWKPFPSNELYQYVRDICHEIIRYYRSQLFDSEKTILGGKYEKEHKIDYFNKLINSLSKKTFFNKIYKMCVMHPKIQNRDL